MDFFAAVFLPAEQDVIERGQQGGNVIWWRHADPCPA